MNNDTITPKKQRRAGLNKRARPPNPEVTEPRVYYSVPRAVINAPIPQLVRLAHENDENVDPLRVLLETEVASRQGLDSLLERIAGENLQAKDPGIDDHLRPLQLQIADELRCEARIMWHEAWKRHTQLRDIVHNQSPSAVRELLRYSWVSVCQLALALARLSDVCDTRESWTEWPRVLHAIAERDFPYLATLAQHRQTITLSDDPIGQYAVPTLMTAASLWCEALDAHGWSPSAGRYGQALFLRYCFIVHQPGQVVLGLGGGPDDMETDNDDAVDEDEARMSKNELRLSLGPWYAETPRRQRHGLVESTGESEEEEAEEEDYNNKVNVALKLKRVPKADSRLAPAPLSTSFLDVGERLFFHHMWRTQALASYVEPLIDAPFRLSRHHARASWRLQHALPALEQLLSKMLRDPLLQDQVEGDLSVFYPQRLLWPGEKEQMLFEHPDEADGGDAYATLFRLRIDHYKRLQRLMHFDVKHRSEPVHMLKEYVAMERGLAHFLGEHYTLERLAKKPLTEGEWIDKDRVRTRAGIDHERFVLLLFELTANKRLLGTGGSGAGGQERHLFSAYSYTDDRSLEGGKARPPSTLDVLRTVASRRPDWPHLICVWQHYVVMGPPSPAADHQAQAWLWTPHLVDALGAWLSVARRLTAGGSELLASAKMLKERLWRALEMPLELLDMLTDTDAI